MLIDGSLQFGDLRALLKVPVDAPSILDLPTDRIQEADLRDVLWRDPSGIDILLAPPRIEMAEMVSTRDVEKVALAAAPRLPGRSSWTCRPPSATSAWPSSTRPTRSSRSSPTTRRRSATRSRWPRRSARSAIRRDKIQYLINRADSAGGMSPDELRRALGRAPEHSVVSDGMLVVQSNNEGVPFVLAEPRRADQPGHGPRRRRCRRVASEHTRRRAAEVADPRPIGVFDSGVGGPDGPARGGPPAARRIDDLSRRQRPRAVRRRGRDDEVRDFSTEVPGPLADARRQGDRRRLQHLDGRRAATICAAATTCRSSASSGRARRPRPSRRDRGGSA